MPVSMTRYEQVLDYIFSDKYVQGVEDIPFEREDITSACEALGIPIPKNLGDVLYTFRYRRNLPSSIIDRAPEGKVWNIVGRGRAKYAFVAVSDQPLTPNAHLAVVKIPDSTPGIIAKYVLSSEQALLAKVRYNRLIDLFTGIVCYSLQNHLRTTVENLGQVETDEIYLGIDQSGLQYVIPVEAKGGADRLSVVQMNQDLALCKEKFPDLDCLLVGAQFIGDDDVSLFLLAEEGASGNVKVRSEKRYRLVPPDEIGPTDLAEYRKSLPGK